MGRVGGVTNVPIIYWAHSYRPEDAHVNKHFGILIEVAARFIVNFDPPSNDLNASKLEQNLRGCDGMVALLPWRSTGPSPYILYEVGMARASAEALARFRRRPPPQRHYSDTRITTPVLTPDLLPPSARAHPRTAQLRAYMGDEPGPRYQPSLGQRTCGIIGLRSLKPATRSVLRDFINGLGYRSTDLEPIDWDDPLCYEAFEQTACLDVSLYNADSRRMSSRHWYGALYAVGVPMIGFTQNPMFPFSPKFPREFQPR